MPTVFSLRNSGAADITIDDLPVTAIVPAHGNVTVDPGNTVSDVTGSFLIRNFVLQGSLELIVNGRSVDYGKILHSQAST